ncbi:MAG: tRNA guanosine(34) transglycosylase Tgt [Phycisphaerae bacterium]|nr:tRNA guanosine(34) transglycosylase Tgt [Phycisphaerae bacterium]
MSSLQFQVRDRSSDCAARIGRVDTPHGSFDTPAFMPVGTRATVRGLLPSSVADTGAQVLLANTYHLMLQPGSERIAALGGLHRFMAWEGPILTDSGGFQVFSLADDRRIDEQGVTFRSQVDGAEIRLTPERAIEIQNDLGADIIMAFDDCPPASADQLAGEQVPAGRHAVSPEQYRHRNRQAVDRTVAWLRRCHAAHRRDDQALFGIVQGGTDLELRRSCAAAVTEMDLPGYAIGGVAVGEGHEAMMRVTEHTAALLPADRPRYLMGVGYEIDLLCAVRAGVDMFDCVLPTRNGRNANAFTRSGQVRLRNARFTEEAGPIDADCDCLACRRFSCAYLRHLFQAGEMLGPILVSLHNLRHFQCLMVDIREAIRKDDWSLLGRRWPILASALDPG